MESELLFTWGIILFPIALGISARIPGLSHANFRLLALIGLGIEIGALASLGLIVDADLVKLQLAAVILLSGLCTILGQGNFKISATVLGSLFVAMGLSLGVLFAPTPIHRFFLIGLFSYVAWSVIRSVPSPMQRAISLIQLGLVIFIILASFVAGNTLHWWAGLFLAVTLLPLIPFHFPFVSIVGSAEGMLSGFWVVNLIALGLAELYDLNNVLPVKESSLLQLLALVSAVYASLKCLGEHRFPQFIAYAAVAQMALLWVGQQVFIPFSKWGIQFGLAVALIMSGLFCVYAFLQQRYGSHLLGKFPGLALSMPRLGILIIFLISLAMLVPILPIFSGLMTMPTSEQSDVSLALILLTFSAVWLLGSWYFTRMLDHTAFGKAHSDVPYTDLLTTEMGALVLLIGGATYSGFLL